MESIGAALAASALFEGLSEEALAELAAAAEEKRLDAGASVFLQGDAAQGFYIVAEGRVRVYKSAPDGKEQTLHLFGPGHAIGEAAVFSGGVFPANAVALEASALAYLPRDRFIAFVRRHPESALELLGLMSRRLMRFAALIEDLSLKEVPGRLAAYLLQLAQQQGTAGEVALGVSKAQLAGLLGTTPESLSRALAKLTREGLIEQTGSRRIVLRDPGQLAAISEGARRLT